MIQTKVKLISNIRIAENYYKITFASALIAKVATPGQFVELKVSQGNDPLLRRPLGIHRLIGENVEILYEVVGKGTSLLSERKPQETLDIIGPLGNGFSIHDAQCPILVAGGMGVAPLVFLAEKLREGKSLAAQKSKSSGTPQRRGMAKGKSVVLIGAKTKSQVLCEKEFRDADFEVKIATDDGSTGFKGYISQLLEAYLSSCTLPPSARVYVCGPKPMLKAVSKITLAYDIHAQVSLEAHMACGIGACLGCVVNTQEGFKRVCKEGPVFQANQILW